MFGMSELDFSNMDFGPESQPHSPAPRQLNLGSMHTEPPRSIAKWPMERTWDKLADLLSPKNDHFINTLKANNTDSVRYLFDILKTPGWAIPRLAAALLGGYGLYTTGQFEIDHQVTSYAAEKRRILYTDFFNIILSVLNATEAVLDFADHRARHKFIQQASKDPNLGPNHRKVRSAKNRLFLKRVWDYGTTSGMVVAHVLFPNYKLEINAIYQGLELLIESPFFGTSVWHYLNWLKKGQPIFLTVVVLLSLVFFSQRLTKDIDGLAKMSINLDKLAANPDPDVLYLPSLSNPQEDVFFYRWHHPKKPWKPQQWLRPDKTWREILSSHFVGNYYGSTIVRQDVMREEGTDVLTLYTIKTHRGTIQRVLTYWTYTQDDIALLTGKELVWFTLSPAVYDEEQLDLYKPAPAHVFIPREEQWRILNRPPNAIF